MRVVGIIGACFIFKHTNYYHHYYYYDCTSMPYCCVQIIKEPRLYCHPNNHHWHQLGKYNWLCMYVGECGSAHRKNNNPVESHFVANKRIIVSTFTHPSTHLPMHVSIPFVHPPSHPSAYYSGHNRSAVFAICDFYLYVHIKSNKRRSTCKVLRGL